MNNTGKVRILLFMACIALFPLLLCEPAFAADNFLDALGEVGNHIMEGLGTFADDTGGQVLAKSLKESDCLACGDYLIENINTCRFCEIFNVIFGVINDLSYYVYENVRLGMIALLGVFLGLWIAFHLASHLSSFVPQSPEEFWTFIGRTSLKAIVIAAFLQFNIAQFTGWFISPLISGAAEFSAVVVESFGDMHEAIPSDSSFRAIGTPVSVDGQIATTRLSDEEIAQIEQEIKNTIHAGNIAMTGVLAYSFPLLTAGLPAREVGKAAITMVVSNRVKELRDPAVRGYLSNAQGLDTIGNCLENGKNAIALQERTRKLMKEEAESLKQRLVAMAEAEEESGGGDSYIIGGGSTKFDNVLYNSSYTADDVATEIARIEEQLQETKEHGIFTTDVRLALNCMLKGMNEEVGFGMAVGDAIMCHSKTMNDFWGVKYVDIPTFIAGGMIWLCCFLLSLIFTFKLIDACFRLGVLACLLPLFMIAWVFPSTAEYAKRGLKAFVQVILVFMLMSVILALAILLIMQAFQADATTADKTTAVVEKVESAPATDNSSGESGSLTRRGSNTSGAPINSRDRTQQVRVSEVSLPNLGYGTTNPASDETRTDKKEDIRSLFYRDDVAGIIKNFNLSAMGFLVALICFIFAILVMGVVDSIAHEFSSVSFTNAVGDKISSSIAQATSRAVQGAATLGGTGAKGALSSPKGGDK